MSTTCTPSLLAAALELAGLGYPVFPCRPGEKTPLTKNGFKNATTDPAQIERWWQANPDANIGLATDGMLVVDVDDPTGDWFQTHHDELIPHCGAITMTPRGGNHLMMRPPTGMTCRCSVSKLASGIDIRADGGYVVVPGSRTAAGEYSWIDGYPLKISRDALPEAPAWLMEEIGATKAKPRARDTPAAEPVSSGTVDGDMIGEGARNDTLTRLAGVMRHKGFQAAEIAAALHETNRRRCQPPLMDAEVDAIANNVARYEAAPMVKGLLIVLDTDEHRVVNDAVKALSADPEMFCRGNVLVRVANVAGDPGTKPVQNIVRVESATLRERLTLVGEIVRATEDGDKPAHPTGWLISAIEARGFWPGIRPLAGVASAPLLRRDGSICCVNGYDPASGVVVCIPDRFPAIPEHPTMADVHLAVTELVDVVQDFRFEGPEHRSAYIAGVITTIARFAFDGPSPLYLVDANIRGAGKGLLCQVMSIIALGRQTAVSSAPSDVDETRKQITTAAINADRIVLFDNVEGKLGNESLDRALTCTRWRDRILGKSEQVDLPLIPTWMATGNNVVVGADTARRIIHIRLDVLEEKPEERKDFKHPNLLSYVQKEQPRLYAAALTIVSAYMKAGCPKQAIDPFGSFEGWSDLVRSAVVWAGLPDPCIGRKRLVESADSARESLEGILNAFQMMDPANDGVIIAPLIVELYPADRAQAPSNEGAVAMRTALEGLPGVGGGAKAPIARAVGNALRRFRRRVVGGVYLDTDSERSTAAGKVWRIFDAETGRAAAAAPSSAPPI